MPLGKREKKWLRPISELGGGEHMEPFQAPVAPTELPSPVDSQPQQPQTQQPQTQQPQTQQPQTQQPQQPQTQQPQTQQPQQPQTQQPQNYPNLQQPQPQPQPQAQAQQQTDMDGGNLDILSTVIQTLNGNPYFIGMLMLLLNLGGRFLSLELTQKQEEFLQQRWLRPLIFFTVIFIATRNLAVAFWMTLALFLVLWILANEQSPFCIIPSWRKTGLNTDAKEKQYEENMNVIEAIYKANQ